jgi:hypothetical protein
MLLRGATLKIKFLKNRYLNDLTGVVGESNLIVKREIKSTTPALTVANFPPIAPEHGKTR